MSKSILTFLTKMSKLLTIPRFWGPLVTIIFVIVYHGGSLYFDYTISLAWIWLPVIAASFVGGFRAGLIAAVVMCIYAVYAVPQLDRAIQIIITVPLVAGLIGWQTKELRRALAKAQEERDKAEQMRATAVDALARAEHNEEAARAMDAMNGNVERVRGARTQLLKILDSHPLDEPTRSDLRAVLHALNNLELATAGWLALKKLRADISKAQEEKSE